MSADKKWRLVAYDVRDPKRYRQVFKILRGTGHSVQYSIFRCRLDDREAEKLRWRLAKVMDPVDRLLVVDLCQGCASKVVSRNHVEGWTEKAATHFVFAPKRDQAPDAGVADQPPKLLNAAGTQGVPSGEAGGDP